MRRVPSTQQNSKIHRDRDLRALSRLALLLLCSLILASGFVFAAQQHFAAIEYGYKSEGLRREREGLLEEKQQLMLKREQAFAPARLGSQRTGSGWRVPAQGTDAALAARPASLTRRRFRVPRPYKTS